MTMVSMRSGHNDLPRTSEERPARLRILLIEDFADARWTITEILEVMGHEVIAVGDAAEARAITDPPDVILSDIGLPDGNGCDLLEEMRGRPGWARIPALAMSGFSGADALQRADQAGFEQYFVKPIALSALEQALAALAQCR